MSLLVIAALVVVALGRVDAGQGQGTELEAERQIAADTAQSERLAIDTEATSLGRAAAAYTPTTPSTPAATLKVLTSGRKAVLGSALFDPLTGRPLAADGLPVSLTGADVVAMASGQGAIRPRLMTSGNGCCLLYFAKVPSPAQSADTDQDQNTSPDPSRRPWLLVLSEHLPRLTAYGDGRTADLLDAAGGVLVTTAKGTASAAADSGLPVAAAHAAKAQGHRSDASGSMLGATEGGRRTVAGWARVASATGPGHTDDLGLLVLTSRAVPATTASVDYSGFGLTAAGALAGIALVLWLVLWFCVQRPLLGLVVSARRMARGAVGRGADAWDEPARPVPVSGFGEPARIGRAMESLRQQLTGESGPPGPAARRGPGCRALALVAVVLVAGWAIPMIFLLNRVDTATSVPASVVADQQARTEIAANRVWQVLDQSHTALGELAGGLSGRSPAAQTEVLRRALADHKQFRSMYMLDGSGDITLRVGARPLRSSIHVPGGSGIDTVDTSGRIPVITVYAQVPGTNGGEPAAGSVLLGEFDVKSLNSLLSRPQLGRVWLTDADDKVLAATVGHRAFPALPEPGLTRLIRSGRGTPGTATSAVHASFAGLSVDAAAPLPQNGPTVGLPWHVVTADGAAARRLPAAQAEHRTALAGILGIAAGVVCLGWLHAVVIRPLRTVALLGERLAEGDRRTVLYPVNHDEVGSLTRSLELIRQALVEGDRGGGSSLADTPSSSRSRPENVPQR
ncbi:HAMP domain-containing protein [Streptomyces sp. MB09-02B]|uniref:HAMP domain-containing protein n=1 Tax=Streptomyces sp. MB09-02B TaxID=3028667 RepID=UPI0029A2B3C0|nr:HAMP domain-containing protein [Streptomyces sp. MB09-02B]MDX3638080.1 HAMP domain-containing protein [Streptomyces sp. MB09-02B]